MRTRIEINKMLDRVNTINMNEDQVGDYQTHIDMAISVLNWVLSSSEGDSLGQEEFDSFISTLEETDQED